MTSLREITPAGKVAGSELVERLTRVFPAIEEAGGDETQLAKASGLPLAIVRRALADPEVIEALAAEHRAAEIDGRLLRTAAAKVALAMLRLTAKSLDAGEADLDDVANLLPKIHRVIEHADDLDVKRKGGDLPTVHVTIGLGGEISAQVVEQVDAVPLADAAVSGQAVPTIAVTDATESATDPLAEINRLLGSVAGGTAR